jgi:hypothetical protein
MWAFNQAANAFRSRSNAILSPRQTRLVAAPTHSIIAYPIEFEAERSEVMLHDPLNGGDADGIAEAEERLIQWHLDDVLVRHALKPRAFACRQQSNLVFSPPCLEQDLPPAPASRGAQATGDPIRPELGHAPVVTDSAKGRRVDE